MYGLQEFGVTIYLAQGMNFFLKLPTLLCVYMMVRPLNSQNTFCFVFESERHFTIEKCQCPGIMDQIVVFSVSKEDYSIQLSTGKVLENNHSIPL